MNLTVAFAGFRHGHIYSLWTQAEKHPEVTLCGAWEEDAETKAAYEQRGVTFCYGSFEELLADERVNVVAIGDYYGRRGELAIGALRAGKHVIADKPLCTSLAELEEIERLAGEKHLAVHSMYSLRYEKHTAVCRKLIAEGVLGEIRNIYFSGQHPLNYGVRPGWYFEEGKHGGTINDIAIHGMDLVRYVTGLEVEQINASRCWNAYAEKAPHFKDSAQFMLTLNNRAGVIADVSYASISTMTLPTYWQFIFWGSRGMMTFSYTSPDVTLYLEGEKEPRHVTGDAVQGDDYADLLAELSGVPGILTTADTIASARTTLQIQQAADC